MVNYCPPTGYRIVPWVVVRRSEIIVLLFFCYVYVLLISNKNKRNSKRKSKTQKTARMPVIWSKRDTSPISNVCTSVFSFFYFYFLNQKQSTKKIQQQKKSKKNIIDRFFSFLFVCVSKQKTKKKNWTLQK